MLPHGVVGIGATVRVDSAFCKLAHVVVGGRWVRFCPTCVLCASLGAAGWSRIARGPPPEVPQGHPRCPRIAEGPVGFACAPGALLQISRICP
eukprot:2733764-Pyramimonas_sp.AAC.1